MHVVSFTQTRWHGIALANFLTAFAMYLRCAHKSRRLSKIKNERHHQNRGLLCRTPTCIHTCNATVVLFHGRFFNRHLIVSLWNSFAHTYRSMVTSVLAANMLVRSPPPDFTTLQAFGRPYSLVFLNLAANENLLSGNEESMRDLHGVLSDIHSILADSGTLVIALPDFKPRLDLLSRESNKNSKRLQKVHGAV